MRKATGKPCIYILFFTDIKRFEGICGFWSLLPLIFVNNSAEIKFRIRQKTSVYFYSRYICLKEGQTLELRLNDTKCTLSPRSEMFSLHLNPSQLEVWYKVSHINFEKSGKCSKLFANIVVFGAFELKSPKYLELFK